MSASKAELRHWVERFAQADHESEREPRYPLSADESFSKALELMAIANERALRAPVPTPSLEDMNVILTWNRIRAAFDLPHGKE